MLGRYENSILLPLSSALFAMGFFSLSFSFPLVAEHLQYSAGLIGLLGLFSGLPFPLVALFTIRMGSTSLLRVIRFTILIMVPASLLFLVLNNWTFIPLLICADMITAAYFVAVEMKIGRSSTKNLAERYSVAWGIPNLIAPIIAGFVLQSYGFNFLFLVASSFFIATVVFTPRIDESDHEQHEARKIRSSFLLVMPMLFGGIAAGFFFYVMIPHLRDIGISYFVIGVIGSVPPLFSALVFLVLNKVQSQSWNTYAAVSAALLAFPVVLFFNHDLLVLVLVFALTGSGSAIAFSKILAYLSKTSSSSQGVFYYETFFGIGYIAGSITGGFLFQVIGFVAVIPIFVPALIYAVFISLKRSNKNNGLAGNTPV